VSDPGLVAGAKRVARSIYAEATVFAVALTALVWLCPE
jgi:hypothetical protein